MLGCLWFLTQPVAELPVTPIVPKAEDTEEPKAVTETEETTDIDEPSSSDDENDYVIARSNKKANDWAKKLGYRNAEELKKDCIFGEKGSRFNIYKNRSTNEIVLIGIKTGIKIFTGLFLR